MSRGLRSVLGIVLGAIGGGALGLGLCVAAAYLFDISQMEGAYAMAVAFFYVPLGAVLGIVAGLVWAMAGGRTSLPS
ncbi:hypothetical protein [Bosea sp. 117]|uniref:hypothetical protein n=1 Tax=Bosea sp. 117 TaxID=1125973 RepID=UPI0004948FBB|nr:hypothetical protein [Bosea sp. 117]